MTQMFMYEAERAPRKNQQKMTNNVNLIFSKMAYILGLISSG